MLYSRYTYLTRPNLTARHNCMIWIDLLQAGPVRETWENIRHTAIAIDAMCVRRGVPGWAGGLGMPEDLRKF